MGMIAALLYAGYLYVIQDTIIEVTYLNATNFLFWWYVVWTIIFAVILFGIAIVAVVAGGVALGKDGGVLRGLFGAVLGGALSLVVVFVFAIRRALYVGGAYFLSTALVLQDGFYHWEQGRLILGVLFLLVAVLTKGSGGYNSRSSTKN